MNDSNPWHGIIIALLFSMFLGAVALIVIGIEDNQERKCIFNTRMTYYNPFYRFGCWLSEPYYKYSNY